MTSLYWIGTHDKLSDSLSRHTIQQTEWTFGKIMVRQLIDIWDHLVIHRTSRIIIFCHFYMAAYHFSQLSISLRIEASDALGLRVDFIAPCCLRKPWFCKQWSYSNIAPQHLVSGPSLFLYKALRFHSSLGFAWRHGIIQARNEYVHRVFQQEVNASSRLNTRQT